MCRAKLFCSLRVLGFILLEYFSLQVHVLRILVLHYKDTLTENMSKKLKHRQQTMRLLFHKLAYLNVCAPRIVLINSI
jgi:hypothetical protein